MADSIANGGGKKEKKHKSSKNKSTKDSAKESTVCVEVDTVHQKKRKKVHEVEDIDGSGKETNASIDVMQVNSMQREKKRKNRSGSPEENQENQLVGDGSLAESKTKKKKKAKKCCIEDKFEDLTQLNETNDYVKPKHKKKKKHEVGSEILDGNIDQVQSGDDSDKELKSKDKKKKKNHKSTSEHLDTENIENDGSIPCDAKKENAVHENKETVVPHMENDMERTSKDKKKKKRKSTSEHLNTDIIENDGSLPCDVKNENALHESKETVVPHMENDREPTSKDKKKKKRKSTSEHLDTENIENDGSLPCDVKKENAVHENKETLVPHIENDMEPTSKDKKKKKLKSTSDYLDTEIIENDGSITCDAKKENSNIIKNTPDEKNGTDTNSLSRTRTAERQYSSECKSIIPFQRVKIDEVKFADERLQDNSYWAKGGADSGYGAKAQEVLGQVRGRDFRHEKTKKKRGSYRGGVIDLESHSIKFNYSDED